MPKGTQDLNFLRWIGSNISQFQPSHSKRISSNVFQLWLNSLHHVDFSDICSICFQYEGCISSLESWWLWNLHIRGNSFIGGQINSFVLRKSRKGGVLRRNLMFSFRFEKRKIQDIQCGEGKEWMDDNEGVWEVL